MSSNPFSKLIQADSVVHQQSKAASGKHDKPRQQLYLSGPGSRLVQLTQLVYPSLRLKIKRDARDVNLAVKDYLPQLIEKADPDEVWGRYLALGGPAILDGHAEKEQPVHLSARVPTSTRERLNRDAEQIGVPATLYLQALILASDPHTVVTQ